jgi:23S rRNA (cytosine1962-C5)-methyltransferase
LIHGEGDGLPGLYVDRLGCLLRVLVTGRASDGFRERAIAALLAQLPMTPEGAPWCVLEVLHLRARGRGGAFDRLRWISGSPDALEEAGVKVGAAGFWVQERGLRFGVDPGWHSARRSRPGYGLFPDQRENRARMAPLAARGGRWLNLFAHTGAFSASLLASGAQRVVSVDLSGPYLSRLEANLEANRDRGVDPARHQTLRGDARAYLETLERAECFAGIVIDPPTAAAAGRRFWSLRQDLEPLLRMAVDRLDEGGALLVTQNQQGAPLGLDRILEAIAARARRPVRDLIPAPAGVDYPSLAEFPEGDAFEGWLLTLE